MPVPVTLEYRCATRTRLTYGVFYTALILFSLHWALVLYVNSSYLAAFLNEQTINILYVVSALCTILVFLHAPRILGRFGNVSFIGAFTLLEILALLGMAYTPSPMIGLLAFVVHQAVVPLILYSLDIFLETMIGAQEGTTGARRGLLLALMSLTGVLSAFAMGKLVGTEATGFKVVYIASALLLLPFLTVLFIRFRGFCDPVYSQTHVRLGLRSSWNRSDIRNVFFAHFLLQVFFTWMVIYTPIYLHTVIGFNWQEIGMILSVGLMAYVLLEYLIGYIGDHYTGEKELMAFGFLVTGVATSWFIFLDSASLSLWMLAMFMTRVGASFVETTTESYFFKHTKGSDTDLISIFRITRPLSYVIGALLGALTLTLLPFELLFLVLGALMIPGMFFAMALKDTN